jgi:hypothetical protein
LFAPNPKGSKLIFDKPFRAGVNGENQYLLNDFFMNELLKFLILNVGFLFIFHFKIINITWEFAKKFKLLSLKFKSNAEFCEVSLLYFLLFFEEEKGSFFYEISAI